MAPRLARCRSLRLCRRCRQLLLLLLCLLLPAVATGLRCPAGCCCLLILLLLLAGGPWDLCCCCLWPRGLTPAQAPATRQLYLQLRDKDHGTVIYW